LCDHIAPSDLGKNIAFASLATGRSFSQNFRKWPLTTEIHFRLHVGDWAESGRVVLKMSFVEFDVVASSSD
jgi:hypothetical protein